MCGIRKRCLEASSATLIAGFELLPFVACHKIRHLVPPHERRNRLRNLLNPTEQYAVNLRLRLASVCFIVAVLYYLLAPVYVSAKELFRYRLQTKDGRQFEYVFESSAEPSPRSVTREGTTRIAANWMATFYHLQLGNFEYAEFYEKPVPHWLVCFTDTTTGPVQRLFFAVVLPGGKIVQPRVSESLQERE